MKKKLNKLGQPFYLNVCKYSNRPGQWFPVWYEKYAGSIYKSEAVKLRKELLASLPRGVWNAKKLKTVKVTLYS